MNSGMQVIYFTHDQCVITNPGSSIGLYYGIGMNLLFIAVAILSHYFPRIRDQFVQGWKALPFYLIFAVFMPLYLYGNSDLVTLTASDQSLRIEGRLLFIPTRTKLIHLEELEGARVGGKNSWLLLDFRNGGEMGIGDDASLGGRANAANAINAWLAQYRGAQDAPARGR